jgi:hypothetical protein
VSFGAWNHPNAVSYRMRHAKHEWLTRRLFAERANPENEKFCESLAKIRRGVHDGSI